MVHCQDVKTIPRPSGLVSWIDANHPEALPTPPVLGASMMGHSTQRSLSIAGIPRAFRFGSVMDASCNSPGTVVIILPQEVFLVDATVSLHPFFMHRLDVSPIRHTTIAHAFNYRVAVLRDGVKSAAQVGRSRKVAERFLEDAGIPWDIRLLSCSRLCAR